ncbi:dethiobiotin synthase [Thauera sinica]|uniref:ATP-dependent dethiobiotin synthetase BioD n=1 Tax=Thauera sinica TaxID=2665146 RepID=A0ABW1AP91_9RHOO|nr:dethiobiotin synthase [Thauera sp. K11]ATE59385.1 dethiobiotin synthase [Thauera sp. K11]
MTQPTRPALRGLFVTGTDTGIGKTRISAALLQAYAKSGARVAGIKPVAAGMEDIGGEHINEDVAILRAAGSIELTAAEAGPCQLEAACAPHAAAALEGRRIEREALLDAVHGLAQRADFLIVEGVGGFRVPFGDDWDSADLARDLGLPVVLVVGLRLGCINHALLTAEAVRARGLRLCGWVANTIDPHMACIPQNLDALARGLGAAPCLGLVPRLPEPAPEAIYPYLNVPALHAIFETIHTLRDTA